MTNKNNRENIINFYLLSLLCILPLMAMDELPPDPTDKELHAQAVQEGLGATVPAFILTLPVAAVAQYIISLPASSATCAITVAGLAALNEYYKNRYPTPTLTNWKKLIALRPQIFNTIIDTHQELRKRSELKVTAPEFAQKCTNFGLTDYKTFLSSNNPEHTKPNNNFDPQYYVGKGLYTMPDQLSKFVALCTAHATEKVPASALVLQLAKRKRKLEKYKEAMIELAPFPFTETELTIYSKLPNPTFMEVLTSFGNPEGPEGIHASRAIMNSCKDSIKMLDRDISDLCKATGAS